jgi:hypothetical protein
MTSNYNSSTPAHSARGTVQPEREPELRDGFFKIPEYPLRLLKCPQEYLDLERNLGRSVPTPLPWSPPARSSTDSQSIEAVQKTIVADKNWIETFSSKRLDTISEEERIKLLEVLRIYQEQWNRVDKIFERVCLLHAAEKFSGWDNGLISEDQKPIYRHDILMVQSFIALLGAYISNK